MRLEGTPCSKTDFLATLQFGWASHSRRLYLCSQHSRSAAFRCREFTQHHNLPRGSILAAAHAPTAIKKRRLQHNQEWSRLPLRVTTPKGRLYSEQISCTPRRNCLRAMKRGGSRRISPSCRSCCGK